MLSSPSLRLNLIDSMFKQLFFDIHHYHITGSPEEASNHSTAQASGQASSIKHPRGQSGRLAELVTSRESQRVRNRKNQRDTYYISAPNPPSPRDRACTHRPNSTR